MSTTRFEKTEQFSGTRRSRRGHRAAAACGALFTLGIVIGDDTINRAGEPPTPMDRRGDSLQNVATYLRSAEEAADSGSYWVGRGVGLLALVALMVFSAYVARAIYAREGTGLLPAVVLVSGGVAAALGLVSGFAQFAAVSRASEGIGLETARALLDLSGIAFVGMWLPVAVLMTAMALAGSRLLPRWFTLTTGVLAASLFIGLASLPATSAGFAAIVLGFLWFVAASVVLVRRAT